jgi:hypothetical protein
MVRCAGVENPSLRVPVAGLVEGGIQLLLDEPMRWTWPSVEIGGGDAGLGSVGGGCSIWG